MKKWFLTVLLAVAGLGFWLFYSSPRKPAARGSQSPAQPANASVPGESARHSAATPALVRSNLLPASGEVRATATASVTVGAPLGRAAAPESVVELPNSLPPAVALENMRTTVRQYGLMFGGNPIGNNQEITKALDGDNPKQVKFLGPDGNRVNEKGELVDVWGTPYFFHQLSAMEMEIRSAGPDKIMWTADDLVIK